MRPLRQFVSKIDFGRIPEILTIVVAMKVYDLIVKVTYIRVSGTGL